MENQDRTKTVAMEIPPEIVRELRERKRRHGVLHTVTLRQALEFAFDPAMRRVWDTHFQK